jgi:lipid-A-disaccharide synthase
MRYYIIAGEASGDLHGSNLLRSIKQLDPRAQLRGWGGDLMEQAGMELVKHYRQLAFMGFAEVIRNLPAILKNFRLAKKDITAFRPDVIIFIDYPGFNLRMAGWAKEKGYKTAYYISPQVWAWKASRVHKIKAAVDRMMVILPFEKVFYEKWAYAVDYVGHPLMEVLEAEQPAAAAERLSDKPVVALLPGSRKQEILHKLPVMLQMAAFFPGYQFIVARAPGMDAGFYASMMAGFDNVSAVSGQTYSLLKQSEAALVTSGTATLETALLGIPEVVCYKGSAISYQIGKRLIRVKYISLVNLIMDEPLVTELIQQDLTPEKLKKELADLLFNPLKKQALQAGYAALREKLVTGGTASRNAAEIITAMAAAGSRP